MSPRCKVWQQVENPGHQELEGIVCKILFFLLWGCFRWQQKVCNPWLSPCSHAVAKCWGFINHRQGMGSQVHPCASSTLANCTGIGNWGGLGKSAAVPYTAIVGVLPWGQAHHQSSRQLVLPVPPICSSTLRWDREWTSFSEQAVTGLTASSLKLRFRRLIWRRALWKGYLED